MQSTVANHVPVVLNYAQIMMQPFGEHVYFGLALQLLGFYLNNSFIRRAGIFLVTLVLDHRSHRVNTH